MGKVTVRVMRQCEPGRSGEEMVARMLAACVRVVVVEEPVTTPADGFSSVVDGGGPSVGAWTKNAAVRR